MDAMAWARPIDRSRPSIDPHSDLTHAIVATLRLAMKTTTKKTSTVKTTATPAKKTVSRAKPAAKTGEGAGEKGGERWCLADLDAVRASERRARYVSSGARAATVPIGIRLTRKTRAIRRRSRSRSVTARRGSTVRFRAPRFDPFELGKNRNTQFSPDALDGSAAKNPSRNVIGKVKATDNKPKARTLAVRARARVYFSSSRSRRLAYRIPLARGETVGIIHRISIAPAIA